MLVHTGRSNGHALRFFRSPLEGPDFCWHSVDDLYAALPVPPAARDDLTAKLHQRWRSEIRSVDQDGEQIVIGPDWMAQALMDVLPSFVPAVAAIRKGYMDAAVTAAEAAMAHLAPMERLGWMMQAARRRLAESERADA